ncbi:MAG: fatty acid desaturase family protein [Acidimicrobiales bacterium]
MSRGTRRYFTVTLRSEIAKETTATANVSTADFRQLALQVREAGLLDRRPTYYAVKICLTIAALAGGWTALVVVGNSWTALCVALFLGAVFAQLGLIGHDAGHQQIFGSRRDNRRLGLVVGNALIGLSYGWWVPKHSAHHSHPNEVGRDPDVGTDVFAIFGDASAREREGPTRFLARWRAALFFPLMLLRSLGLHVGGIRDLHRRRDRESVVEGLLILFHAGAYFTIVLLVLSPLKALAFVAVQQAVFSIYLGLSFAPNHKGMPLIADGAKMSFAHRQIATSRTVSGGALLTFALGGLNYQIEHHLFPSMPRPNLRRAQSLVKAYCQTTELAYCEVSFLESFRQIVRHLRAREQVPSQKFAESSVA